MGPRELTTPDDINPSIFTEGIFTTGRGTNQIYYRTDFLTREVDNFVRWYQDILNNLPAAANGAYITPQDMPDPIRRGINNLFLRSLRRVAAEQGQPLNVSTLRTLLPPIIYDARRRHELIHVYDGAHAELKSTGDFVAMIEQRGDVGAMVGYQHADLWTALLLEQGRLLVERTGMGEFHAPGAVMIRNRIAFHLAQDQQIQKGLGVEWNVPAAAKEISDFPLGTQEAVWNALGRLSPNQCSFLFRRLWFESQFPTGFLRGALIQVVQNSRAGLMVAGAVGAAVSGRIFLRWRQRRVQAVRQGQAASVRANLRGNFSNADVDELVKRLPKENKVNAYLEAWKKIKIRSSVPELLQATDLARGQALAREEARHPRPMSKKIVVVGTLGLSIGLAVFGFLQWMGWVDVTGWLLIRLMALNVEKVPLIGELTTLTALVVARDFSSFYARLHQSA